MNNIKIRLETKDDYRAVEELTREALWNVYTPGALDGKKWMPSQEEFYIYSHSSVVR